MLALAAGPTFAAAIDDWRWERRLLVVFADAADDARLAEQRARIAEDANGFGDRRLLLVTVIGDVARGGEAPLNAADLRDRFGVQAGFAALLIGLDGGEKARSSTAAFTMSELFAKIDRMPMRRRELEARGNG